MRKAKNNNLVKKTILSIIFVLVLIVIIFLGTSSVFQPMKGTMAVSDSDCIAAGGLGVYQSGELYCCPKGYTRAIHTPASMYGNLANEKLCSTQVYSDDGYIEKPNDYFNQYFIRRYIYGESSYSFTGRFPVYRTKVSDSRYELKKNSNEINKLIEAWEDCGRYDDTCRHNIETQLEDKKLSNKKNYNYCDSLLSDSKDTWKTYNCTTYFEYGFFTTRWYLYCDCMPSKFETLYEELGLKLAGAGCYKQTNGTYKWMLKADATSSMTLQTNISTKSACDTQKDVVERDNWCYWCEATGTLKYQFASPSTAGIKCDSFWEPLEEYNNTSQSECLNAKIAVFKNGDETYDTLTCKPQSGKSSCKISVPKAPSKSGYTFAGWGDNKNCTSGTKTSFEVSNRVTKYACWVKNSSGSTTKTYTYKVTFDANGGQNNGKTNDSCTTTGSSCDISSLPTATRDGYEFTGWGTSNSCTTGTTSSLTLSSSNITYYACWEPKTYTYKAHFDANGGTINGNQTKTCDTKNNSCNITSLPTATRDGYEFTGWGTSNSCTTGTTSSLTLSSSNTTYYACWKKTEFTYNATFDANGGILNGDTQMSCTSKESSCELNGLPTATLEGYSFTGWGNTSLCVSGNTEKLILNREQTTYYACWLQTQTETVTYEVEFYDGKEKIQKEQCTIEVGEALCKIQVPEYNPEVENKLFAGWDTSEGCTSGSTNTIDVYENTIYYACYSDNPDTTTDTKEGSIGLTILYIILFLGVVGVVGYLGWKWLKSRNNNTV